MSEIGKYHKLRVIKKLDFGVYLQGEDDEEILLPRSYINDDLKIDDFIDVFIYRDSEDRVIATTLKPFAIVGEFAFLKVNSVNKTGAFLDWGLPKDLMVPYREQKERLAENRYYLVRIYIDKATDRIAASTNFKRFLSEDNSSLTEGQEVDLIIYDKTDIGYNVIIDSQFRGIVYKNEIFKRISPGLKTKGYIKKIREDGKVDVSLQQYGYDGIEEIANEIMKKLGSNNGILMLSDKSDPKQIYHVLQTSKKVFKKAVGLLYRQKKITINEDSIQLKIS